MPGGAAGYPPELQPDCPTPALHSLLLPSCPLGKGYLSPPQHTGQVDGLKMGFEALEETRSSKEYMLRESPGLQHLGLRPRRAVDPAGRGWERPGGAVMAELCPPNPYVEALIPSIRMGLYLETGP